jgi:mannose-6-phosphate isomerase
VDRLTPVIFTDAWGSQVSIAGLQGRATPTPHPESELWMGAHEAGPSRTDRAGGPDLATVIGADPTGELGPGCVARFGPRLPFLLKVLAPGRAISIQVHPTAAQARAERARTGDRVYVDDEAKPELLLALTPFEVFVGLRRRAEIADIVARLGVPQLTSLLASVADSAGLAGLAGSAGSAGSADPEHALLAAVLATPADTIRDLADEVVTACRRLGSGEDEIGTACAAIARVAGDHPGDIGLVVLVLMRHRMLRPGEYVDVAAGVLHSYVGGLGIEVLANSDNVVRAGLTSKPVNVPELLRVVDPRADGVVGRARAAAPGLEIFDSASDRFTLHRVAPGRDLPGAGGPRLVFCLRGDVALRSSTARLDLGNAESAFLPATEGDVALEGSGEVYLVTIPDE